MYTVAYIGRLNYAASAVKIITAIGLTGSEAGLIASGFALVYGIGQLVNGILCKHYNPKFVVTGALLASAASNLLLPMSGDYLIMAVTWMVNGAAQSVLWSSLIRTLSVYISDKEIGKAIYVMSSSTAIGTAAAYGLSALFVHLEIWQVVFYTASALLVLVSIVWVVILIKVERNIRSDDCIIVQVPEVTAEQTQPNGKRKRVARSFIVLLVFVGVTAVANGFVKDGANTWVPKLLNNEFGVPESLSIILTLTLPVCGIIGAAVSRKIYNLIKDHTIVNGLLYAVSALLLLGVFLTYPLRSVPLTLALFMVNASLMAAINNVITSMFPLDNRNQMDSGFLAGGLDTICYLGSTLAGVGLGVVSDYSWDAVLLLLMGASAVSMVIALGYLVMKIALKRKKAKSESVPEESSAE